MVGGGIRGLRDARDGHARPSARQPELRRADNEISAAPQDGLPLGDGEMKMQTLTTVVTWSAIAIAAFMGFTAFTIGVPFFA
jgi:hypothetical protein